MKKHNNLDQRIIPIPETMKNVKKMLKADVLTYCALNPRNGYPIEDPKTYFHLVSVSKLTDRLMRDILKEDKNRLYGEATHLLAVISDKEYAVVHNKAKNQKTIPVISKFFYLDMTTEEVEFFSKDFMDNVLGHSIEAPNGQEEVHFIRVSEWNQEREEIISRVDKIMMKEGVCAHYIHLVKDEDADRINNLETAPIIKLKI